MSTTVNSDTDVEAWLCDNPLNEFAESKEVPSLIAALSEICNDPYALEASQERFLCKFCQ